MSGLPIATLDRTQTKLFIENLPDDIDETTLRKRFQVFGNLESAALDLDQGPGSIRLATCNYVFHDDAFAAFLGMNNTVFEGRILKVSLAGPRESYEDVKGRSLSIGYTEPNLDTQKTQVCDHQNSETGHVCGEGFASFQGLANHWRSHSWDSRAWKCEKEIGCVYSKRGFTTEIERDRHHSSGHPQVVARPYKCSVASCLYHKKGFETPNSLSLHEKAHSMEFEEHLCSMAGCSYETGDASDLENHMEEVHGTTDGNMKGGQYNTRSFASMRPMRSRKPESKAKTSVTFKDEENTQPYETQYAPLGDQKTPLVRDSRTDTTIDYRPFKCQVKGCKFLREGFETQNELLSHEDREHNGERSIVTSSIQGPAQTGGILDSLEARPSAPPSLGSLGSPSTDFLQCNNVDCSDQFTLEQEWRKHAMNCKVQSGAKQCSFNDCQAKFDSVHALSSHEYGCHGIRICSSLTCNRAFHQAEDAEAHMRDMHSNLYNEGRRPRLAFIASVPSWNTDIGEMGFPYDPYRCALLNISPEKLSTIQTLQRNTGPQKGKEASKLRGQIDGSYITWNKEAPGVLPGPTESTAKAPSRTSARESLPRYSAIMAQSSQGIVSQQLARGGQLPSTATVNLESSSGNIPAHKPRFPLVETSKPGTSQRSPQELDSPRYQYNSDGSRYVTGTVVLSPDKHRVLVLASKSDPKGLIYQLPSGFLETNDQNMEASALRECWQNAGVVGRVLRAIQPAPAEEPDENGVADWHSYFEVEVEKERDRWPKYQVWHRRWLDYREARVALSSQPDAIRALERSTIFKRGSNGSELGPFDVAAPYPSNSAAQVNFRPGADGVRPKRKVFPDQQHFSTRKYNTISPATDNIAVWRKDILPWLRRNFSTVMGKNKHGAIELLRVRNKPTICITCSDPKELQLERFAEVISGIFPLHVKVGLLARSSDVGNVPCLKTPEIDMEIGINEELDRRSDPSISNFENPAEVERQNKPGSVNIGAATIFEETTLMKPEKAFRSPPVFGSYIPRPSCGATIGIATNDESSTSAGTFGGVIILVKQDGTETPYGLISHHVIEEKNEDTELGVGVDEGWLINSTGAHRFPVQQPAKMDLEEAKDSLDMQRYYCDREKRYCDVDDGRTVRAKLATLDGLDQQCLEFGQVTFSSGYGFDANRHQMDWALVGDIPPWRLQDNHVAGADMFYDLHYDGSPKAPYPVEKSFFSFISETFEQEHSVDLSEIDPLRRIHGVGSYSGLMDGIVSSETAFFRLDGMDSEEWFFTPRYARGLGVKGDSGTWVFDDFGKVVGQIIAYNYRTDTAYFTRMDYLFEHIKSKTKAIEVYIPFNGELSKWRQDDSSRHHENVRSGSITDTSSSYVDSSFSTTKTSDTDLTSPLTISDSGLGWTGFTKSK